VPISAVRMYVEKVQQVRILRRTADKVMEECREIILRQYVTNLEDLQFMTRQRWAARPITEAHRPENNPEGEISIDWFVRELALRLNKKQRIQRVQPIIGIKQIVTQSKKYPESPSFVFYLYHEEEEEE